MKIEVTTLEFIDTLKNGSTNQRILLGNIIDSGVDTRKAIEILEEEMEILEIDPRDPINGGILHFGRIPANNDGVYILPVNEKYGFIFE